MSQCRFGQSATILQETDASGSLAFQYNDGKDDPIAPDDAPQRVHRSLRWI
jgi:hypothetical protein